MHSRLCQTVDILTRLIAFDTTSRNSNLELINWIQNYLRQHSIDSVLIPHPEENKANLLARIGPQAQGGYLLSGHTDVVPVEGQDWASDPFTLTPKEDKLYGRGTADMKGFLACCLAMTPHFAAAPLRRPIYFAFSYDEEIGCLGAPHLIAHLKQANMRPDLAVIGEPTMMHAVTAHKGICSFETTVTGRAGHSSDPARGVNAIDIAVRLISFLNALAEEYAAVCEARFDPPHATIHVGVIQGGTARNIIPSLCRFWWEIRSLPGQDANAMLQRFEEFAWKTQTRMQQVAPEAAIVTRPQSRVPGLRNDAEKQEHLVMRWAGTNQVHAVSFATEAGLFQRADIPAVICGPGSIEQAHKPDEYIATEQLAACIEFLARLAEDARI